MIGNVRWLEPFSWHFIVAQNEILCPQKKAHHDPTSDGHTAAMAFWEESRLREMSLFDAIEVCRKCHRLAPFTNYSSNTFAAIARSLAGHIVAGVVSDEEIKAFHMFCEILE
jgi:hypothetical protein